MAVDITTSYLPEPWEMTTGQWTITSPVPTVRTGKLIALWQGLQQEQTRRTLAGEPLVDENPKGWPDTDEEVARLILGETEYERLADQGCPAAIIAHATLCALVYWANGGSEAAVYMYLKSLDDMNAEKAGARPKG